MEKFKKYNIGLDIGTTSVGWAVVETENQKILRKGNKPLWGIRLFEEASKAEARRNFRSTRRRYDRRRQRISLLQEEFKEEINKVDSNFYIKLQESKYVTSDTINKTIKISDSEKEKLKKYLKECPTIYHLREKLINNTEKEDIRLVYLAIHHIIKYRGNFLYNSKGFNVNNLNIEEKIKEAFDTYFSYINTEYDDYSSLLDIKKLSEALMQQSKKDAREEIKNVLTESGLFENKIVNEFIKMMIGNKFKITALLSLEDSDSKLEISFDGTEFEDKYDEIESIALDKIEILEIMKELYDTLFLKKLFKGSNETNISSLMVKKYNEHKEDLKFLKKILKSDKELYKKFFKNDCIYEKYITNNITYDEFIKEVNNAISKVNIADYNLSNEYVTKIAPKIANGNFMPRITSTENGKYPYQLNKDELLKIIENQGKYYPFLLNKTNDGTYKIVKLLEFRIPYFVGPLVNSNQSKFAWMARNSQNVKITPYNFDEVINKELTAEKFIKRMISNCTYLLNEPALPNNSISYNNFKVLNELKQIRINGELLEINLQHKLIEELFKKTNGTITEKKFKDYLLSNNEFPMHGTELNITGYSADGAFANNMQSYIDFFGKNGIFEDTSYTINDAENIIEWITIFDDKDILEQKVRKNYPKLNDLKIKSLLSKKYKGWGSLSSKLLNTKYYIDKKSNTKKSILDLMYETKENFMQIINNDEYNFQQMINEINNTNNDIEKLSYKVVEPLATSPANKRGIYQALKIVDEIVNYIGYEPESIAIEMARNEDKKERKDNKKKYIENLYKKSKGEIENYNKLQKELNQEEINSQKMFLYFIQEGKCLYSGKPLNIEDLDSYEIDHIIPRTLIKDDSIDNKALVYRECNQNKAASYVLPQEYRNKYNQEWWKHLRKIGLMSAKKYHNLIRKEYSEEDIEGFINRQLVETRQITKHVANILNTYYKNTKVIYLKAKLSHDYRDRYDLFKFREINDYHHAHDAYLAAVLGEYKEKYLNKDVNFEVVKELNHMLINSGNKDKIKYGYVINSLDEQAHHLIFELSKKYMNEETGEVIFNAEEFNKRIEDTLYRNDILVSKKTEIRTGEFYNQTKNSKGNKGIELKKNMPTELYGSYTSLNPAYAIMVKYTKKNKTSQKLIGIPIYLTKQNDETIKDNYIRNILNINMNDSYEFTSKPIPFFSKLNWNGQICYLVGASDTVEVCNAQEFNYDKEFFKYHKLALQKLFNNKNLEINDNIYSNMLDEIIKYIVDKIEKQYKLFGNLIFELKIMINYDNIESNSVENKENIIKQLTKLLNCKSDNANFKFLNNKFSSAFGKKNGRTIEKFSLINLSVSGIYQKETIIGE